MPCDYTIRKRIRRCTGERHHGQLLIFAQKALAERMAQEVTLRRTVTVGALKPFMYGVGSSKGKLLEWREHVRDMMHQMTDDIIAGLFVEALTCELAQELSSWRRMIHACLKPNDRAHLDDDLRGVCFADEPLSLRFWTKKDLPFRSRNKRKVDQVE